MLVSKPKKEQKLPTTRPAFHLRIDKYNKIHSISYPKCGMKAKKWWGKDHLFPLFKQH